MASPEIQGWKKLRAKNLRCGNSKIALYILPARRQPGPRVSPLPAAADPAAAHPLPPTPLLLTPCCLHIRKKSLNTPR